MKSDWFDQEADVNDRIRVVDVRQVIAAIRRRADAPRLWLGSQVADELIKEIAALPSVLVRS